MLNFDALTMVRSKQRANLALGVALFVVFVFVARSFVVDSVFEDRNESSFLVGRRGERKRVLRREGIGKTNDATRPESGRWHRLVSNAFWGWE